MDIKEKIITGIILTLCLLSVLIGVVLVVRPPGRDDSISVGKGKSLLGESPGVAVVYIYGPIYVSEDNMYWSRMLRGSDRIIEQLRKVEKNNNAKAVVLRINSPGGSVGAVQEVYNAVKILKEKGKKVVVSMGDVCASGGYYISCACDKLVANPGTITGSIGVIMRMGNLEELFRKIGVEIEVIKSGKYKDIGSASRKMTGDEKKLMQGVIDDAYDQFLGAVVEGRGFDIKKAKELCQGQIFTGHQAMGLGLVDEAGDFKDAIRIAGELAGIEGEPRIIDLDKPMKKFFDMLMESVPTEMFRKFAQEKSKVRLEYLLH